MQFSTIAGCFSAKAAIWWKSRRWQRYAISRICPWNSWRVMVVQGGTGFADGVYENALQGVRSCDFRKKHIHLVTDGNGKRPHY
jgi:hypothetical protein